jgi:hypothetical protein
MFRPQEANMIAFIVVAAAALVLWLALDARFGPQH